MRSAWLASVPAGRDGSRSRRRRSMPFVAVAVDEVEARAADALDRRECRARRRPTSLSTSVAPSSSARSCAALASLTRKAMAQAHGPWLAAKSLGEAVGLGVDDEIDVALAVEGDVLALVPGDRGEAHLGEQRAQQLGIGRGIFDELEAVGAHRILEAQRAELGGGGGGACFFTPCRGSLRPVTAVRPSLRTCALARGGFDGLALHRP